MEDCGRVQEARKALLSNAEVEEMWRRVLPKEAIVNPGGGREGEWRTLLQSSQKQAAAAGITSAPLNNSEAAPAAHQVHFRDEMEAAQDHTGPYSKKWTAGMPFIGPGDDYVHPNDVGHRAMADLVRRRRMWFKR
jgi:hypothetical protein